MVKTVLCRCIFLNVGGVAVVKSSLQGVFVNVDGVAVVKTVLYRVYLLM